MASFTGLYVGISLGFQVLIAWGVIAGGPAVLTPLAQREKRLADQRNRRREEQDAAVYLALRSRQATVPELLTRMLDPEVGESILDRPPRSRPVAPVAARGSTRVGRHAG